MNGEPHTGAVVNGAPDAHGPDGPPGPSLPTELISDLRLERLHAGEPNAPEAARATAALSPTDRDRLAALGIDDASTLAALPPALVAAEVRRRAALAAATRRPAARVSPWAFAGLAVAAALVIWRVGQPPDEGAALPRIGASAGPDTVRAKGAAEVPVTAGAELLVYRQRAPAEAELLHNGDAARPGDALQLGWVLPEPCFGALVSMDGAGAVTVHHADGSRASALAAGRHVLDHAFVLDAAPAYERFVLITGAEPFNVAAVVAAARAQTSDPQAPLAVPAGLSQTSLRLLKVAPQ